MTKLYIYITLFISVFFLLSCSTQKNTWTSRSYNAMTAKYNTLFNGEQSIKQATTKLQKGRKDNFIDILPLFSYSGEEQSSMVSSESERAIEKGLKVIQKKSISERPKKMPRRGSPRYNKLVNKREFNPVVKNAYTLIGKAHLYNHSFIDALSVLDYAFREFPEEKVQFEILLLTAQTRIEMGDYENAKIVLDKYNSMSNIPLKLYGEFSATYGEYLIRTEQYNAAIPFVKSAAEEATKKWDKVRRNYVLAQLYQATNQPNLAAEYFRKVIRLNPDYEMALNSTINYAITTAAATNNPERAKLELQRQVNQYKNEEYRDQLYYAIATLYLQDKDTANTLLNLKLSLGYNTNNDAIKLKSYHLLGALYFDKKNYIQSFAYYDSTMTQSRDIALVDNISKFRWEGLSPLSKELGIINEQDSLQWLASLSETDREAFVDNIIERERLAELNRSLKLDAGGYDDFNDSFLFQNQPMSGQQQSNREAAKWYFYNPATVSMGKMEFERRWGRRALKDNWRRSDQSTQEMMTMDNMPSQPSHPEALGDKSIAQSTNDEATTQSTTSLDKETLLANIPTTPEKLEKSKNNKSEALFKSGITLMQHFEYYNEAKSHFDEFIRETPNHHLYKEVLFWNYICCTKLNNSICSNKMKAELNSKYPETQYTAYTNDPDFIEKQLAFIQQMNLNYEEAYISYKENKFNKTKALTSNIIANSQDSSLIRKSHLLKGMAEGKTGNANHFEQHLTILATNFPKTQEGRLATKWLEMFNKGHKPSVDIHKQIIQTSEKDSVISENEHIANELFTFAPNEEQYLWIIFNRETDANKLIFNIADYNFNRFSITTYDIATSKLQNDSQRIITVGPFNNSAELMDYYYGIRSNIGVFNVDNIEKAILLGGTKENISKFVTLESFDEYEKFFAEKYIGSQSSVTIDLKYELLNKENNINSTSRYSDIELKDIGIEIENNTNIQRITTYIKGETSRSLRINTGFKEIDLKHKKIIYIQGFTSEKMATDFISTLKNNRYWNNQLNGKSMAIFLVNSDNIELIKSEGNTINYLNHLNQLNK